jgi:hypothetical protein
MTMLELPGWLPGSWMLSEYSITTQGSTMSFAPGEGPFPVATTLAFTQGSTTYDYEGGSIFGRGSREIVSTGEDKIKITLWPTGDPSLPAEIARTTNGIVVMFSITTRASEPSDFKAFYVQVNIRTRVELPGWLPGSWMLSELSVTTQGSTMNFPPGTGPIQVATTLAFTQGSTTYDYEGGPVGRGSREIVSTDEDKIRIMLWPTNVLSLPAEIARTTNGIVVMFSNTVWGNELSDFKAFYVQRGGGEKGHH